MTSSSGRVSSGGLSTTRRIPTSSTDRLGSAISSRMTVLQLLPVFLLLSCMLFLIFLVVHLASAPIVLQNPLWPTSTGNDLTLHHLSLQSAIRSAYLRLFLSCASSQFSSHRPTSLTAWILVLCLVFDWFPRRWGKLTSCLDLL